MSIAFTYDARASMRRPAASWARPRSSQAFASPPWRSTRRSERLDKRGIEISEHECAGALQPQPVVLSKPRFVRQDRRQAQELCLRPPLVVEFGQGFGEPGVGHRVVSETAGWLPRAPAGRCGRRPRGWPRRRAGTIARVRRGGRQAARCAPRPPSRQPPPPAPAARMSRGKQPPSGVRAEDVCLAKSRRSGGPAMACPGRRSPPPTEPGCVPPPGRVRIRPASPVPRRVGHQQPNGPDDLVGRLEPVGRVLGEQPAAQFVVALVQAESQSGDGAGGARAGSARRRPTCSLRRRRAARSDTRTAGLPARTDRCGRQRDAVGPARATCRPASP